MNKGKVIGKKYIKYIDYSKAVIWKDRVISLNREVVDAFREVYKIVFIDRGKGKMYYADLKDIQECWELKKYGQEEQYYFPIEILKTKKL